MSEDVGNNNNTPKETSRNSSFTQEESESSSLTSTKSLKFPFTSHSKNATSVESDSSYKSSCSTSSTSNKSHYIYKLQQKSGIRCLPKLEESKQLNPLKSPEKSKVLNPTDTFTENILEKLKTSSEINTNYSDQFLHPLEKVSIELKNIVVENPSKISPKRIFVMPRLTSSESQINRKTQEIGKNAIKFKNAEPIEHKDSKVPPDKLEKPIDSDQDSRKSLKPISLFENEKYRSFSDSNSQEEDIIDTIKAANRTKLTKNESKIEMEIKNSSLMSVPSMICRICQSNAANEKLLSPCYCKGSLAYVHLSCLEKWLNQASRNSCELCLYQFNAVETLRYGLFEGLRLWIRHPRNRNHVRSDCLIAFLLTLITLGLVVICFIGMDYFIVEGIKLGVSRIWTRSFIVSFLGLIMMGYSITMYLIAKDQFVPWYHWWKNTLNIRLVLSPAAIQTQRL